MDTATEANAQTIATEEGTQVVIPTQDDLEAKNMALEAEKNRLIDENANYKVAYLKEKRKNKGEDDEYADETDEERVRRITREELSKSRISQIASEQKAIADRAIKENKELKLAQLNRTNPQTTIGTHNESIAVTDTLVTQDQLAAFKARGWSEEKIKKYKDNLRRYSR